MQAGSNPLRDLRDLHLPDPISIWPLAPGWYVLIIFACTAAFFLGIWLYKHWWKNRPKRSALYKLQKLKNRYEDHQDTTQILSDLSTLLRRAALAAFPRHDVAGLQGIAWMNFLDKTAEFDYFSTGSMILITGPYQKKNHQNLDNLFETTKSWIEKCM